jgi:hypothetical protein
MAFMGKPMASIELSSTSSCFKQLFPPYNYQAHKAFIFLTSNKESDKTHLYNCYKNRVTTKHVSPQLAICCNPSRQPRKVQAPELY